jgi:hypothetical protein
VLKVSIADQAAENSNRYGCLCHRSLQCFSSIDPSRGLPTIAAIAVGIVTPLDFNSRPQLP